jgi:hypothetical protein
MSANLVFILFIYTFAYISCKNAHFLKNTILFEPVLLQIKMQSKAIITSDTVGAYCFINDNGIIYDLNTLRVNDKDYNRTFSNNDLLAVNMCGKANKNCANKTALATYTSANNQCLTLSGDQNTFIQYRISCNL